VEAVEEASAVLSWVREYNLTYPIFIDTEGAGGNGRADGLDADARTLVCEAFCRTIENAGYQAGVYASRNWYNNNLQTQKLENYYIWLAEYRSVPLYQGYYRMWQYSSKGSIDGIKGNVDMNIMYE
jgi:GH25 family lysozyme M1 (1,4-beta-N-acetylmuramidase)